MDKIFECNIIKQDSILCNFPPQILPDILKFLPLSDVVCLSHTCKELHRKLPFCLIKRNHFEFEASDRIFNQILFEGRAINFSISKINIFIELGNFRGVFINVWAQIIRCGTIILQTEKNSFMPGFNNWQFQKSAPIIRKFKPADRLRLMVTTKQTSMKPIIHGDLLISLQLENYKYDKPLYVAMGYAGFKNPLVTVRTPEFVDRSSRIFNLPETGDTYFYRLSSS